MLLKLVKHAQERQVKKFQNSDFNNVYLTFHMFNHNHNRTFRPLSARLVEKLSWQRSLAFGLLSNTFLWRELQGSPFEGVRFF